MRFSLILATLVFALFFMFEPRLPNYFSSHARAIILNSLISKTQANRSLNPQQYWETREFYYPGVFYVFKDGLTDQNIADFESQTMLNLKRANTFPILVYSSTKLHSYESLVNTNQLLDLVNLPDATLLYEDGETKIMKNNGLTYIFFIKPYSELMVTNGFIYTKEEILKNYQFWFGVSVITE